MSWSKFSMVCVIMTLAACGRAQVVNEESCGFEHLREWYTATPKSLEIDQHEQRQIRHEQPRAYHHRTDPQGLDTGNQRMRG